MRFSPACSQMRLVWIRMYTWPPISTRMIKINLFSTSDTTPKHDERRRNTKKRFGKERKCSGEVLRKCGTETTAVKRDENESRQTLGRDWVLVRHLFQYFPVPFHARTTCKRRFAHVLRYGANSTSATLSFPSQLWRRNRGSSLCAQGAARCRPAVCWAAPPYLRAVVLERGVSEMMFRRCQKRKNLGTQMFSWKYLLNYTTTVMKLLEQANGLISQLVHMVKLDFLSSKACSTMNLQLTFVQGQYNKWLDG